MGKKTEYTRDGEYSRKKGTAIPSEEARRGKAGVKYKRFGIECFSEWSGEWTISRWYATEKQRDQAFDRLTKHPCNVYAYSKIKLSADRYRKVQR
jgi:hypothetical protein